MCRAEAMRQMRYVICQTRYVIYQTWFWCFNLFKTVYCFAYCCVFSLTLMEIKFSLEVFIVLNVLSMPPFSHVECRSESSWHHCDSSELLSSYHCVQFSHLLYKGALVHMLVFGGKSGTEVLSGDHSLVWHVPGEQVSQMAILGL